MDRNECDASNFLDYPLGFRVFSQEFMRLIFEKWFKKFASWINWIFKGIFYSFSIKGIFQRDISLNFIYFVLYYYTESEIAFLPLLFYFL